MRTFFYKKRFFIAITFGIICSIPILLVSLQKDIKLFFFSVFLISNSVLAYSLIMKYLEKFFKEKDYFLYKEMKLNSDVFVKEIASPIQNANLNIACFEMNSKELNISFKIECNCPTKKYKKLNIDTIMIKPDKNYSVCIKKETILLDGLEIQNVYIPISIDYYNLQDKFYTYDLKTNNASK